MFGSDPPRIDEKYSEENKLNEVSAELGKLSVNITESFEGSKFNFNQKYKTVSCISSDMEEEEAKQGPDKAAFGLLEFERPVVIVPGCKG